VRRCEKIASSNSIRESAIVIGLPRVDWPRLEHAYGSAENVPALLAQAKSDTRGGHVSGSAWFELWSALCHQGTT
jgi:hypothetical protein